MNALMRWLERLLPAWLSKRLGASTWGGKSAAVAGQPQPHNLRLWTQSGVRCWPGKTVPASGDFLCPEFTLTFPPADGLSPPAETVLTWSLLQGASWLVVCRRPLISSGPSPHLRGPAISLRNAQFFPHPGSYSLVASIGELEVARFPFRIVGDTELVRQVKVTRVAIDAEKQDGQLVPGLKVLRCQEHRAIRPSLRIETGIPAPNSLVHCSVQTLQGTRVLGCEDFVLPLDQPGREVTLRRMEIKAAGFRRRTKSTRFTLAVYVGGDLKAVTPFLLLPADRITDAEGALTQNANDLPVDDLEYEQIMNGLAVPIPPLAPRRFWR